MHHVVTGTDIHRLVGLLLLTNNCSGFIHVGVSVKLVNVYISYTVVMSALLLGFAVLHSGYKNSPDRKSEKGEEKRKKAGCADSKQVVVIPANIPAEPIRLQQSCESIVQSHHTLLPFSLPPCRFSPFFATKRVWPSETALITAAGNGSSIRYDVILYITCRYRNDHTQNVVVLVELGVADLLVEGVSRCEVKVHHEPLSKQLLVYLQEEGQGGREGKRRGEERGRREG